MRRRGRTSQAAEQGARLVDVPQLRISLSTETPVELSLLTYPQRAVSTHLHAPLELGVLLGGAQTRYFEGFSFQAAPGDVWMIPMWEPHGWETLEEPTQRLVIHFLPDLLGGEMIGDTNWLAGFAVAPPSRPRAGGTSLRQQVSLIARELWEEAHEQQPGWVTAARANLLRLLVFLYRFWARPTDGTVRLHASSLYRIMPVVTALQKQPERVKTVAEAAELCGLSQRHFQRLFAQTMGVGFRQFRLRARLAQAERMLTTSNLCLDRIAEETGFIDRSHLHRHFAKRYGCAPGAFRKRVQARG